MEEGGRKERKSRRGRKDERRRKGEQGRRNEGKRRGRREEWERRGREIERVREREERGGGRDTAGAEQKKGWMERPQFTKTINERHNSCRCHR